MNTDIGKLQARLRAIQWAGLVFIALTIVTRFVVPWPEVWNGLLLGEAGGAGVVWSMVRQGHLRDDHQGSALMVSGIIGFFTRILLLIAVIVLAIKLPHINVVAALAGYLLGFVFIVAGLSRSA